MSGRKKDGSLSMAAVQPKHRKFIREVAKGRSPDDVVKELYPNDDMAVALRRIQTPAVLTLLESFVSAQWEKPLLLSRLNAIVADESTKQNVRVTALRLGAQVSGYLNNMAMYKPSRRQVSAEDRAAREARLARLKELAAESAD